MITDAPQVDVRPIKVPANWGLTAPIDNRKHKTAEIEEQTEHKVGVTDLRRCQQSGVRHGCLLHGWLQAGTVRQENEQVVRHRMAEMIKNMYLRVGHLHKQH